MGCRRAGSRDRRRERVSTNPESIKNHGTHVYLRVAGRLGLRDANISKLGVPSVSFRFDLKR